ncbi:flavin reductase (DIM6/NTAB) family NADH-FMN oxidoreductase RutF [Actinocorallia herbida]|uniref:Flavin reductase (DIM6/NTAB) family NADH-FMN oxidoreductase RutF n=1 Tax=Actinocorallia herbida TaxID=58109 RepID=A0A3N1CWG4_9ACTN|nr:flavin reductase [Actinocorallia herbida]ROO85626.1 flavin reductase (DIM6/NTAB) family NADH-FMN oxidoreductase RutF [Actinocorallia herbida]
MPLTVQRSGVIESARYRQVLGQYPTGVVVVTALDAAGTAVGMVVGSFTSVSLDPPLVAFLPDKNSSSWRSLRESGDRFCVNVLAAAQEDVCRAVATRKTDKFHDIGWQPSPQGNPIIDGAVAWIDCVTEQIHDAGDHDIVIGRVLDLDLGDGEPLLFYRGGYGSFMPHSLAAGDADLLDQLRRIDLARPHMEGLADLFGTEVTAITLVRDELVLAASAGRTELAASPTRVGQRLPFAAPLGSCYAAYGDAALRERWLSTISEQLTPEQLERLREVPDTVRGRGYAIALGHSELSDLERISTLLHERAPDVSPETLREAMARVTDGYNPADPIPADVELRSLSAPVFAPDGTVAFTLTVWGPAEPVAPEEVTRYANALLATATNATRAIA